MLFHWHDVEFDDKPRTPLPKYLCMDGISKDMVRRMARFRLSYHKLNIDVGRHNDVS